MFRFCAALTTVLLCFGPTVSANAQRKAHLSQHSTFFDPEDDKGSFSGAKPPSDRVLDALLETQQVKDALDEIEDQTRESLRSYFIAVLADAGESQNHIYVVHSIKLPLGSGDSDWFWIVRVRERESKAILFIIGHTLTFKRHKSNGYHDLLLRSGTPAQPVENLFRFDGEVYRLFHERFIQVKP